MANRKNSGKQRKQQNSSRPAYRSSSNRYPGEPRRTDARRYYEDREYADYRRSYTKQSGRYEDGPRYYEDRYAGRTSGYDSRYDYRGSREYGSRTRRDYGYPGPGNRTVYEGRRDAGYRGSSGVRRQDSGRDGNRRRQEGPGKSSSGRNYRRDPGRKSGRRNQRTRRPVRLKKRFYFFVLLLILIIAVGGYFGVRALVNNVFPAVMDRFQHTTESSQVEEDTDVKETKSGDKISDYDSVTMERMILDDLGTPDTQIKVINSEAAEESEGEGSDGQQQTEAAATDENTIDLAKLPNEEKIRAAVLSSWYISPLGQDRATIEESFGVLNKYEDWAGGVYYHKGFPDSMYIMYKGKNGSDGMPGEHAVCSGVSVALEQIIEFDPFLPNEKWGAMHKDNGDFGWTEYYYSLLIQKGINLIVYCDPDGTVNQQTHIIVRQVK